MGPALWSPSCSMCAESPFGGQTKNTKSRGVWNFGRKYPTGIASLGKVRTYAQFEREYCGIGKRRFVMGIWAHNIHLRRTLSSVRLG